MILEDIKEILSQIDESNSLDTREISRQVNEFNSLGVKEVLRRVDEFNSLDTRDVIAHTTIGTHRICHVRFALRQLVEVSFIAEEAFVSVDRDEYVSNNWSKVLEKSKVVEIEC